MALKFSLLTVALFAILFPLAISSSKISSNFKKPPPGVFNQFNGEIPVFVAHRGDKALIPEHTIPAYDIAMLDNVEFVEPDLVMTKDMVLVCHHDITLRDGTDIAQRPEFAHLMTENITLFLDGKNTTILNDWLISNLTLAQLKTLTVYQKNTGVRPQYFNGLYRIPTFQEYIEAVHKDTWRRRQFNPDENFVMGIIPELKHPVFHSRLTDPPTGHLMEVTFMTVLRENGYMGAVPDCKYNGVNIPCSPLVVQCFDVNTIEYLSTTTDLRLLTLLDIQNLKYLTYNGMASLSNKTEYLGIWKEHLYTGTQQEVDHEGIDYDRDEIDRLGGFVPPDQIVSYAHGLGMKVGIFTIYQAYEESKRGCAVQCENSTKEEELNFYFDLGVDAFFVEGIMESKEIRSKYFRASSGTLRSGFSGTAQILGSWTLISNLIIATVIAVYSSI